MIIRKVTDTVDFLSMNDPGRVPIPLDHRNWIDTRVASALFDVAHDGKNIYINYSVTEETVRAVNTESNSSVWEDSCVEFFISFENDRIHYYNFEINAIGTCLGGYGSSRHGREQIPGGILDRIGRSPSLGTTSFAEMKGPVEWTMQTRLPVSVFVHEKVESLSGIKASANFYKCGDLLPIPHFLSWKPVGSKTPDFHLTSFFGKITFE